MAKRSLPLTIDSLIDQMIARAGGDIASLQRRLNVGRTTILTWRAERHIPIGRLTQISELMGLPLAELAKLTRLPHSERRVPPIIPPIGGWPKKKRGRPRKNPPADDALRKDEAA